MRWDAKKIKKKIGPVIGNLELKVDFFYFLKRYLMKHDGLNMQNGKRFM